MKNVKRYDPILLQFINFIKIRKKRLSLLIIGSFFLFISAFLYENKVFSFSFVDEQSNIVTGFYLLKGEKIYSDIFQHHQPFAYIISASVQKVIDPDNLYLLIKRHREFIILWSSFWSIVLLLRFGFVLLPFIIIYELTKIYIFGNLFLAESLVVYPLIFLILYLFLNKQKKLKEIYFIGMSWALSILLLAPIWPLCFALALMMIIKFKFSKKELVVLLIGVLPILILSIYFSSVSGYLYSTFFINLNYYIPDQADPFVISALKGFLTPFISFDPSIKSTSMLWIIRSLSLSLIFYYSIILYKHKNYLLVITSFLILGLANIRYVQPGSEIYSGFHSLPWFAIFIIIVSVLFAYLWKNTKKLKERLFYSSFIIMFFAVFFGFSSLLLFENNDIKKDQYVNYSWLYDYGTAIKIMKSEEDNLFVIPDQRLLYWQADIRHASKTIAYYAWMENVPYIKDEVDNIFEKHPPTFLYCEACDTELYINYSELLKTDKKSKLFVLNEKLKVLSKNQIKDLKFFGFKVQM